MIQITYQKRDGSIFYRIRNTLLPYKIGDTTSMGWKVINIEYKYNNKYYKEYEYNRIIYKNKQRYFKIKKIKEFFIRQLISLLNYILGLIIIYLIIYK